MKIFGFLIVRTKNKEAISIQAYDTGKRIERIIEERSDYAISLKKNIEAKCLSWYAKTKDEEFAKYIGIRTHKEGKI